MLYMHKVIYTWQYTPNTFEMEIENQKEISDTIRKTYNTCVINVTVCLYLKTKFFETMLQKLLKDL